MGLLAKPDELTAQAFRHLRGDSNFQRVLRYWQEALEIRDGQNRTVIDGVQLRMGQGAATAVAEMIEHAMEKATAGALADTRQSRAGQRQSDT